MSLSRLLPEPVNSIWDREDERRSSDQSFPVSANLILPPYGQRRNWIPRAESDFNGGGAFPEIHVAQYPLDMGAPRKHTEKRMEALPVRLDECGKVKYDEIARQGQTEHKTIYSHISQLLPREVFDEDADELQRPSEEMVAEETEKTRLALQKLTKQKISAALPARAAPKATPSQYIRYTPAQMIQDQDQGSCNKQRIIRMVESQVDPMEPPKFRINKKIPRGPPSPPAPVLHSPTKKITSKEQLNWHVPPCISNWKNPKGYTIPLDKRISSDGRGLQQVHINENFAKLAESLYIADRKAREAVEARAQLEKKIAKREREQKEESLRLMAQKAREQRSRNRLHMNNPEAEERYDLRNQRARERYQNRNQTHAAAGKSSTFQHGRQRDISEQIALGVPQKSLGQGETLFDSRLLNRESGTNNTNDDSEAYNVYDAPWNNFNSKGLYIYRPNKQTDVAIGKTILGNRDGPVEFDRDDDPFGLDKFLNMAKNASKREQENNENNSNTANNKRKRLNF